MTFTHTFTGAQYFTGGMIGNTGDMEDDFTSTQAPRPPFFVKPATPGEIREWLAWAGGKLMTLEVKGTEPGGFRTFWPDYPDNRFTAYGYTGERLRPPPPGSSEIPLMDQILNLVLLVPNPTARRILNARALVHPLNGRNLYSWAKIGVLIHSDRRAVRNLHQKALEIIAAKIPSTVVRSIRAGFLSGPPLES